MNNARMSGELALAIRRAGFDTKLQSGLAAFSPPIAFLLANVHSADYARVKTNGRFENRVPWIDCRPIETESLDCVI